MLYVLAHTGAVVENSDVQEELSVFSAGSRVWAIVFSRIFGRGFGVQTPTKSSSIGELNTCLKKTKPSLEHKDNFGIVGKNSPISRCFETCFVRKMETNGN